MLLPMMSDNLSFMALLFLHLIRFSGYEHHLVSKYLKCRMENKIWLATTYQQADRAPSYSVSSL